MNYSKLTSLLGQLVLLIVIQLIHANKWTLKIQELTDSFPLDGWSNPVPPVILCNPVLPPYKRFYDFSGQIWTRHIDFAQEDGFSKGLILFDLYIIRSFDFYEDSALPFEFSINNQIISTDFPNSDIKLNSTYCSARNDLDYKFKLKFLFNSSASPIFDFTIKPLNFLTQWSIKNFFIFVQECVENCQTCNYSSDFCILCKASYELNAENGNHCNCEKNKNIIYNGLCIEDCPIGYFIGKQKNSILQFYTCFEYNSKQNILTDNFNEFQIKHQYIKDTLSNTFYSASEGLEPYQKSSGPYRFNDKLIYHVTKQYLSSIVQLELVIQLLGNIDMFSSIKIFVNDFIIGGITWTFTQTDGIVKNVQNCSCIGFSDCKQGEYFLSVSNLSDFSIKLEISSNFNITDPNQAWIIKYLSINEIQPKQTIPYDSLSNIYLYKKTFVSKCPNYSTLQNNICVDYDEVYPRPQYIYQAFYDTKLISNEDEINWINFKKYFYFKNRLIPEINGKEMEVDTVSKMIQIRPSHNKIKLFISILLIDWQSATEQNFFQLKVSDQQNKTFRFYSQSSEQFNEFQIDQEYPDYIHQNFSFEMEHSAPTITIQMFCSSPYNAYCSVFDFFILINRCLQGCSECDKNDICLQRDFSGLSEKAILNLLSLNPQNGYFSQCLIGYFLNSYFQCEQCLHGCKICYNILECIVCEDDLIMKNNQCFCPNNRFNGNCKSNDSSCFQMCETCSNNGINFCTSCNIQQFKILNINRCECIYGYYMTAEFECKQCSYSCQTCSNFVDCKSCQLDSNREMIEQKCECKKGYYEEIFNVQCKKCSPQCVECFIEPDYCIECDIMNNLILKNGQCICQEGYFQFGDLCQQCKNNCKTCLNQYECTDCNLHLYRILKQKDCICNIGYFEDELFQCQQCHYSCEQCNKSNQHDQCTKCPKSRQKQNQFLSQYQCVCRKGYYEVQSLECLGCNTIITTNQAHPCYSFCGDKIVQWNEECDDGNLNDNYDLKVANKYHVNFAHKVNVHQGEDGYYLDKLNFCQKCSESCLTCFEKDNYCLSCKIYDENHQCVICENSQGYQIIENNCTNICGDSIKVLNEQCDDGNLMDGDGCDSNCQIEPGFICNSQCDLVQDIKIILTTEKQDKYFDNVRHIYLNFNQEVLINGNFSELLKLQVVNSSIEYTFQIFENSNSNFNSTIVIQFIDSIQLPLLKVVVLKPSLIVNLQNVSLKDSDSLISIQLLSFIKQEQNTINATENSSQLSKVIIIFLLSLAGLCFITGGLNIFFNLLDALQTLAYLKYFNIVFPYNIQTYFQTFGFAEFDFLKEFISINLISIDFQNDFAGTQPDQKFAQEGYTTLFIINILSVLTVFLTALATLSFSKIAYSISNNFIQHINSNFQTDYFYHPNLLEYYAYQIALYVRKISQATNNQFFNCLIRTFLSVAMDLNMAIFLQLKCYNETQLVSFTLSGFTLLIEIYIIFWSFSAVSKPNYQTQTQNYLLKFEALYEGISYKRFLGFNNNKKYFNIFILVKKLLFMFFLIFFYNFPFIQIGLCSLTFISFICYILISNPQDDQSEFLKLIVSETILWIQQIILILICYIQNTNLNWTDQNFIQMEALGWSIIAFSIVMLVTLLIIDIKQHSKFLYQKYLFIRKVMKFINEALAKNDKKDLLIKKINVDYDSKPRLEAYIVNKRQFF